MLNKHDGEGKDTVAIMAGIGRKARAAAHPLALASTEQKRAALSPWPMPSWATSKKSSKPMPST